MCVMDIHERVIREFAHATRKGLIPVNHRAASVQLAEAAEHIARLEAELAAERAWLPEGKKILEDAAAEIKRLNIALDHACDAGKALTTENERLRATFTGDQSQPALEMIRAKCEQYWNDPGPLCAEEWHNILEFIHRLARTAEAERAVCSSSKYFNAAQKGW